jgi:hypothetical protein
MHTAFFVFLSASAGAGVIPARFSGIWPARPSGNLIPECLGQGMNKGQAVIEKQPVTFAEVIVFSVTRTCRNKAIFGAAAVTEF